MQRLSTAFLLASALVVSLTGLVSAQDRDSEGEQQMLARINAMRAAQQLAPLDRHGALDAAAIAHSAEMAASQTLTHVSPTTGTPADRARAAGVQASTIAENVALHRSTEEAHQALLGSEGHRNNMMSPAVTHVGLAAVRTPQGIYVTQLFAAIPAPAPPTVVAPVSPQAPPAIEIPPPSIEPLEVAPPAAPRAIEIAPAPQAAPAEMPQGQPGRPLAVAPGNPGQVIVQRGPDGGRVAGYWVYGSGRWWYYPLPPNAAPGQRLVPNPNVIGPPPGYAAHPFATQPQPQIQPRPQFQAQPQAYRIAPAPQYAPAPRRGAAVQIGPFGGQVTIAPSGSYYAVPPPPMAGQPSRSYLRAQRQWQRQYRRWLRAQGRPL